MTWIRPRCLKELRTVSISASTLQRLYSCIFQPANTSSAAYIPVLLSLANPWVP
ncbi:hypothetical protein EMPG_11759 [Blastomyces silverae]|uniref:Uncharacterized protein n=1 Tax=Blastomyces silverae TaxID=2060906 RepID=A0A0H1BP49_9EURO|nr:hypothetical protein EMPG_11759 [Blastomyces silverae]